MMDLFLMPLISTGPFSRSAIAACAFETARVILDLSVSKSTAANAVRHAESTMVLSWVAVEVEATAIETFGIGIGNHEISV